MSSFTDTAGITTAFTSGAPDYNNLNQSHLKPATRTAIACVLSIVGTLALVAVWYLVRRIRRRRHAAAVATPYTAAKTSAQESGYDSRSHGAPDGTTETQLDLIASREGHRILPPIITQRGTGSPIGTSSPSDADPFSDYSGTGPILGPGRSILGPSRSATYDSSASPSSTIHDPRGVFMTRNPSRDALLSRGTSSYAPSPVETTQTTTSMGRSPLPLMLHDRSMGRGDEIGLGAEDDEMTDLKRDTLAYLGDSAQPGSSRGLRGQPSSASAPAGRRRRREEEEMEYMVHRDAGRVLDRNPTENGARVLELPPRYEELDWDREREREERERSTR